MTINAGAQSHKIKMAGKKRTRGGSSGGGVGGTIASGSGGSSISGGSGSSGTAVFGRRRRATATTSNHPSPPGTELHSSTSSPSISASPSDSSISSQSSSSTTSCATTTSTAVTRASEELVHDASLTIINDDDDSAQLDTTSTQPQDSQHAQRSDCTPSDYARQVEEHNCAYMAALRAQQASASAAATPSSSTLPLTTKPSPLPSPIKQRLEALQQRRQETEWFNRHFARNKDPNKEPALVIWAAPPRLNSNTDAPLNELAANFVYRQHTNQLLELQGEEDSGRRTGEHSFDASAAARMPTHDCECDTPTAATATATQQQQQQPAPSPPLDTASPSTPPKPKRRHKKSQRGKASQAGRSKDALQRLRSSSTSSSGGSASKVVGEGGTLATTLAEGSQDEAPTAQPTPPHNDDGDESADEITDVPSSQTPTRPVRMSIKLPPISMLTPAPSSSTIHTPDTARPPKQMAKTAASHANSHFRRKSSSNGKWPSVGSSSPAKPADRSDAVTADSGGLGTSSLPRTSTTATLSKSQKAKQRAKAAKDRASTSQQTQQIAEIVSAAERGELLVSPPLSKKPRSQHTRSSSKNPTSDYFDSSSPSKATIKGLSTSSLTAQVEGPSNDSLESFEGCVSKAGTEESFQSAKSRLLSSSIEYATAYPADSPRHSRCVSLSASDMAGAITDPDGTLQSHQSHTTSTSVLAQRAVDRSGPSARKPASTSHAAVQTDEPFDLPVVVAPVHGPASPIASSWCQMQRSEAVSTPSTLPEVEPCSSPNFCPSSDAHVDSNALGDDELRSVQRAKWRDTIHRTEKWRQSTEDAKRAAGTAAGNMTPSDSSVWWSSPDCSSTRSVTDDVKNCVFWDERHDAKPDSIMVDGIEAKLPRRVVQALPRIFGVRRWPGKLFTRRKPSGVESPVTTVASPNLRDRAQLAAFAAQVSWMPSFEHEHQRHSTGRESRLARLHIYDIEAFVQTRVVLRVASDGRVEYGRAWRTHSVFPPGKKFAHLLRWRPPLLGEHREDVDPTQRVVSGPRPGLNVPETQPHQVLGPSGTSTGAWPEVAVPSDQNGWQVPEATWQHELDDVLVEQDGDATIVLHYLAAEYPTSGIAPLPCEAHAGSKSFVHHDCSSLTLEDPSSDAYHREEAASDELPAIAWMDSLHSLTSTEKDGIVASFRESQQYWKRSNHFWCSDSRRGTLDSGSDSGEVEVKSSTVRSRAETEMASVASFASSFDAAGAATTMTKTMASTSPSPLTTTTTTLPPEVASSSAPLQYFRYRRNHGAVAGAAGLTTSQTPPPRPPSSTSFVEGMDLKKVVDVINDQLKQTRGPLSAASSSVGEASEQQQQQREYLRSAASATSSQASNNNGTGSGRTRDDYRVSDSITVTREETSPKRQEREAEKLKMVQAEYESRQRHAQHVQATMNAMLFAQQQQRQQKQMEREVERERRREEAARLAAQMEDEQQQRYHDRGKRQQQQQQQQHQSQQDDEDRRRGPPPTTTTAAFAPYGVIPAVTDSRVHNQQVLWQQLDDLYTGRTGDGRGRKWQQPREQRGEQREQRHRREPRDTSSQRQSQGGGGASGGSTAAGHSSSSYDTSFSHRHERRGGDGRTHAYAMGGSSSVDVPYYDGRHAATTPTRVQRWQQSRLLPLPLPPQQYQQHQQLPPSQPQPQPHLHSGGRHHAGLWIPEQQQQQTMMISRADPLQQPRYADFMAPLGRR